MSFTLSVFTFLKGGLFLAKSSGFKIFIAKALSPLIGKIGVAETIKAGVTVAAITGVGLTIYKFPKKVREGFNLLIKGMAEGKSSDFFYGLLQLSGSFNTANELIEGFKEYVDVLDFSYDAKVSIKKSIEECKSLITAEIEHQVYLVCQDVEKILINHGETVQTYEEKINRIYENQLDTQFNSLKNLLGICGCIYEEISLFNEKLGIKPINEYDHYLVYCIAGYVKEHFELDCIKTYSQQQLADAITNQIFDYLHASGRG